MTPEQIEVFGRLMEAGSRGDGDAACRLGDVYREAVERGEKRAIKALERLEETVAR